jgi:basic membrane protein A and related proteins
MRKTIFALTASAAMLLAGGAFAQDKTKACFIYVGPIGDFGWSYQHHQGALEMQEALGGEEKVEIAYLESVPEGADAERAIERFARSGCNIVFTTSFGYMDATNKVAAKFPDVKFEHATGFKREHANVATYNSKFHEGRYVQGVIAAKMSEKGLAGYIASFPIPEVVMGINAFVLGAQSVNPDFKVKVVWANTWFDPGKEADAAKALIDQGVDIITQHTDSTAPMQVAAERGIKAFGQASDMIKFGPETQLTSIIDDWGHYYTERVKAVMDGTWEHQHARRREEARRGDRGEDQGRLVQSLHRTGQEAGRLRMAEGWRGCRGRRPARSQLLRRGCRRPASAVRPDGRQDDRGAPRAPLFHFDPDSLAGRL